MENKNDTSSIFGNLDNETSTPDRKFRIQTDWSDTGPNSHPIGSTENSGNFATFF